MPKLTQRFLTGNKLLLKIALLPPMKGKTKKKAAVK